MARPIQVKSDFKTESVENGATSKNAGLLKSYKLLKLVLVFPYSTENGAPNRSQVMYSFEQSLNYSAVMFAILLHQSK
jgi:hypothetical protein